MKKVLFICRYNRYRSQIAAGLFNKYCPKNIATGKSAGLIQGQSVGKEVKQYAKLNKIKITKPKGMVRDIVNKQDIFVLVANDVPPSIFTRYKKYGKKVIVWKIKDINETKDRDFTRTNSMIKNKVVSLIDSLKNY